jgi:hypothetical protein
MFSKCLQLSPELLEQEYQSAPLAPAKCHELGPGEQAAAEQLRNRMFEAVKGHKKEQTELMSFAIFCCRDLPGGRRLFAY